MHTVKKASERASDPERDTDRDGVGDLEAVGMGESWKRG